MKLMFFSGSDQSTCQFDEFETTSDENHILDFSNMFVYFFLSYYYIIRQM